MAKKISRWQLAGFLFVAVAGTLLHFLFDWTKGNVVAGLVSAVNESIWEHMKLLYFPAVAFSVWEARSLKLPCFWTAKLLGLLTGLLLIPVLFYTYTGALGVVADWFNVTIFFIAGGVMFARETWLLRREKPCASRAWMGILLLGLLFIVFTFLTPRIPLFQDPITGTYGYQG